ncbi:hypothetical protein FDH01_gp190 [Acinetobacter phage vB_AbaM_ME3]|uniref:Uncharacterized protein n=1 Tax=Acinetobacter phage vB_AbaM_ME3 TaxID=1837876 RepID=A0A172Q0R2_9CAUD|nr:hypothetical protein FDH01_gp190 [Acinetobacter phage vB_AbaM_ME3]AND75432.1 hypothetical protein ME3_271 [Acinetobacter phage vB_AbaM_ME3]
MIEKIFAINFVNMNSTLIPDEKSNKDYVVVIPYLNTTFSIVHNRNRKEIEITLVNGKVIKTSSRFVFSKEEIKSIKCSKNAVSKAAAYSYASCYVDLPKDDALVDANFPTYKADDFSTYRRYFNEHSQDMICSSEVKQHLFRIPLPSNYFKYITEEHIKNGCIGEIRLPTSYNDTMIEGDYIYTNNVSCVKRSLERLIDYLSQQQPCKVEKRKKGCINLLDQIKHIVENTDHEFSLRVIFNSLTKTLDNYQREHDG